eukprot:CAMPEP_0185205510 /NCGR_PEP_ID=MMETSP1140-20130426/56748_1 /TAXON_ID=298111 /ORGANISM="Pavlova sp., Strain CCMP459" /LENGTH=81 /DNA_ID=CAMNT_0027773109 /DNA_START=30 /DNA_END=271 /DNA_ORIENTATION=+
MIACQYPSHRPPPRSTTAEARTNGQGARSPSVVRVLDGAVLCMELPLLSPRVNTERVCHGVATKGEHHAVLNAHGHVRGTV